MALLERFDVPGQLRDIRNDDAALQAWSDELSRLFGRAVQRVRDSGVAAPAFYDPTVADTPADAVEKVVLWPGFPRQLLLTHGADRRAALEAAEAPPLVGQRRPLQDEYLEWHTTRDANGRITRVDFTCEPPEYWAFLGNAAPTKVLQLYRRHIDPAVTRDDLFENNRYDPLNTWNSAAGAMHLTQRSNSLGAEVNLAADATVVRRQAGALVSDADALIACGKYGEPRRASDPTIGAAVNTLARDGFAVTLRDPVGLYIHSIDLTGFTRPDGRPVPRSWFKVTRGSRECPVRASFAVPAGETANGRPFVAGDLTVGGVPLDFGGQLAAVITMRLTGVAHSRGSVPVVSRPCAR
jgi:hypothetical protein